MKPVTDSDNTIEIAAVWPFATVGDDGVADKVLNTGAVVSLTTLASAVPGANSVLFAESTATV